jgi:photosystem II stability/assembly factor-like uncharacterized protein
LGADGREADDTLGKTTWVSHDQGAQISETSDGGLTWSTVTPSGLPVGVASIHLISATSAIAEQEDNGCTGVKTGCWAKWYLYATADGGRDWARL